MSDTPINLNKVRKNRAKAAAKAKANKNAVAFGRGKSQRAAEQDKADRLSRAHDGKALDPPPQDKA